MRWSLIGSDSHVRRQKICPITFQEVSWLPRPHFPTSLFSSFTSATSCTHDWRQPQVWLLPLLLRPPCPPPPHPLPRLPAMRRFNTPMIKAALPCLHLYCNLAGDPPAQRWRRNRKCRT